MCLISFVYASIIKLNTGSHRRLWRACQLSNRGDFSSFGLGEILALGRFWWAGVKAVHIQPIGVTRPSPVVAHLLLPPLPPSLYIVENGGNPAAEDHTRACELQLRYMVVDAWLWSPNWYILYIHIGVSDNAIYLIISVIRG